MPVLENRSAAQWGSIINDLTTRSANTDAEAVALASEGDKLALDAELGIDGAAQRLQKIRADGVKKLMAANNLQVALASARQRHAQAVALEAVDAEKERLAQIGMNLEQYVGSIREIDAAMEVLVQRFGAAAQSLERATALMRPEERAPFNQVPPNSMFASTLAAAHHGLADYMRLGAEAGHLSHRQPLAAFVQSFTAAWLEE